MQLGKADTFKVKTRENPVHFGSILYRGKINAPVLNVVRSAGEEHDIRVVVIVIELFVAVLRQAAKAELDIRTVMDGIEVKVKTGKVACLLDVARAILNFRLGCRPFVLKRLKFLAETGNVIPPFLFVIVQLAQRVTGEKLHLLTCAGDGIGQPLQRLRVRIFIGDGGKLLRVGIKRKRVIRMEAAGIPAHGRDTVKVRHSSNDADNFHF